MELPQFQAIGKIISKMIPRGKKQHIEYNTNKWGENQTQSNQVKTQHLRKTQREYFNPIDKV